MSGMIVKYPDHNETEIYQFISGDSLAKTTTEYRYFDEQDIVYKIIENKEGYFDFNKSLIDVGACFGAYSMMLNYKHNYCFEPNKSFCCLIHTNMFIKDKVNNTDVYNVALSDVDDIIKFDGFYCDGCECPYLNDNRLYDVQSKMLDFYNLTDIDLIKIDVEGFEERVIRGGLGTIIRNNYPSILFECWNVGKSGMTQEKHDSLFNLLNSLGYEILVGWGNDETHLAVHK